MLSFIMSKMLVPMCIKRYYNYLEITSNCNLFSINETDVRNYYIITHVGPFLQTISHH